jgi:hypothetical protein
MKISGQLRAPAALTLGKYPPPSRRTNYVGGVMGFRAGLDAVEKKRTPCLFRNSSPDC